MWELPSPLSDPATSFPPITLPRLFLLATALLVLRWLLQQILALYFRIRPRSQPQTAHALEHNYLYHLSIVLLVLVEIDWNMVDLALWVGSYVGIGLIRSSIRAVKVEKELLLTDCSYRVELTQVLSASKIFGLMLFTGSAGYFLLVQSLFAAASIKLGSLLLFPTLMLGIDSLFLLFSSHQAQKELLLYYNHNVNQLPSHYKTSLLEQILGNSVRIWHYLTLAKLFLKSFLQRHGALDRLWILSALNAFYSASAELYHSITKYRTYQRLVDKFNQVFRPTHTPPDQNCVICMSELLNCRQLSTCGHLFHYKCLFEWVQTKSECPICRSPI